MTSRFCYRCRKERDAALFTSLIHRSTGRKRPLCAVCVEAVRKGKTEEGKTEMLARDHAARKEARSAWANYMKQALQHKQTGESP